MTEASLHHIVVLGWFALAALTFVTLQFVSAPYGKHARAGWGPTVPARAAWVVMETPPAVVFAVLFLVGDRRGDPVSIAFLAMYLAHYVYRAWIYPLRMRTTDKRMPALVCGLAFTTNIVIAYVQARWLFTLGPPRDASWLVDPRFVLGLALFVGGYWLNHHSDSILRNLRRPGDSGYQVPTGGAFRWVSSPHYLGEIVEWTGWALATWCLPTAAFLAWTISNLAPRAAETHAWYRERFPDYPQERRALVPGLW